MTVRLVRWGSGEKRLVLGKLVATCELRDLAKALAAQVCAQCRKQFEHVRLAVCIVVVESVE